MDSKTPPLHPSTLANHYIFGCCFGPFLHFPWENINQTRSSFSKMIQVSDVPMLSLAYLLGCLACNWPNPRVCLSGGTVRGKVPTVVEISPVNHQGESNKPKKKGKNHRVQILPTVMELESWKVATKNSQRPHS